MMSSNRIAAAIVVCAVTTLAALPTAPAWAARVGVVSNEFSAETAADFTAHIPGHTFTAVDVSAGVPSLDFLTANFDEVLLFEDTEFANAPAVGNVVASFASAGHPVVIGTFYDQDRSDVSGPLLTPHGWGAMEQIDPNTTDGHGTPYAPRAISVAKLGSHPLTAGLTSLWSTQYAGGNQAKSGTTVVARWEQRNANNAPDPAIAYRVTGLACVMHIAIAPDYASVGSYGVDFGGDFYQAWQNAFDYGAADCKPRHVNSPGNGNGNGTAAPTGVPTLSDWALALTSLLVLAIAFVKRRRLARR
jgi:hypothetical protein